MLTRILIVVLLLASTPSLGAQQGAQQIDPTTPPPPPSEAAPASTAPVPAPVPAPVIDPSSPPPPPPEEAAPAPAEPAFDPLHAGRSIDVGTFYMKKGNYDAAIDRFEEAARYQPTLAKPWILLGETYEKKHDNARAIESYKKYLEVFPGAADAAKVQKRIAVLEEKAGQPTSKDPAH